MKAFFHFIHGHSGRVLDGMPDGVGEAWFFLSKNYARLICGSLSEKEGLRDRDGTFNLVIT